MIRNTRWSTSRKWNNEWTKLWHSCQTLVTMRTPCLLFFFFGRVTEANIFSFQPNVCGKHPNPSMCPERASHIGGNFQGNITDLIYAWQWIKWILNYSPVEKLNNKPDDDRIITGFIKHSCVYYKPFYNVDLILPCLGENILNRNWFYINKNKFSVIYPCMCMYVQCPVIYFKAKSRILKPRCVNILWGPTMKAFFSSVFTSIHLSDRAPTDHT